ncbi:MAG: 3-phosphoshikimate 1-carboxyvinyltransferase [Myxococcales bacterium]|nr:3-phosphoshikimate 1-carboxyvinyltransferase [Myxococcales bacterium]
MRVEPSRLAGAARVPGDKSITHRAVLVASIAEGVSEIVNPGLGADNLSTLGAVRALGVEATHDDARHFTVVGRGLHGWTSPSEPIDCGNSGTTARLLSGMLAGAGVAASLVGDASLSRRPMRRVAAPLTDLGYTVDTTDGHLPLVISDAVPPEEKGVRAVLNVASAQVKSAILLSGLWRSKPTEVVEPAVSRDHTERLLRAMGARVASAPHYLDPERYAASPEAPMVTLQPGTPLSARRLEVPGDPSSAAFLLAAALLVGDGVVVEDVCTNPTRIRLLDVLQRMGGAVSRRRRRVVTTGEPVADLHAASAPLGGTEVSGFEIPLVIDEIPVLCVLGAAATGRFIVRDAGELRVKESDRIERVAALLAALGVTAETRPDGLEFDGLGGATWSGFEFDCGDDHRIAMAAIVAALAASTPSELTNTDCVAVSFPDFAETIGRLGAKVTE